MELSPGSFRTFVVGTSYQLGNLVSSASSTIEATIEATIGERFPLSPKVAVSPTTGKKTTTLRYNYGKVICIFLGCVYVYVILLTMLGPENRGRNLNVEYDQDMREAAGEERFVGVVGGGVARARGQSSEEGSGDEEKVNGVAVREGTVV